MVLFTKFFHIDGCQSCVFDTVNPVATVDGRYRDKVDINNRR